MSRRRFAPDSEQPATFAFSDDNRRKAQERIAMYPEGRSASAILPLLWIAQKQADGWLPRAAIRHVAEMIGVSELRASEVASFYTMFNLAPVGRHLVQVCGTTPCRLRGAEGLLNVCRKRFGPPEALADHGRFTWREVECLGACVNAPAVQINDDYYEDLDDALFERLLDRLAAGETPPAGSQIGRAGSAPRSFVPDAETA